MIRVRVRLERGPLGGCVLAPVVAVGPDRFSVKIGESHVLTFDRSSMQRIDGCCECGARFRYATVELPA